MRINHKLKKIAYGDLEVKDNRVTSMMIYENMQKENGTYAVVCRAYREVDIEDDLDDEFA